MREKILSVVSDASVTCYYSTWSDVRAVAVQKISVAFPRAKTSFKDYNIKCNMRF